MKIFLTLCTFLRRNIKQKCDKKDKDMTCQDEGKDWKGIELNTSENKTNLTRG